MKKEPLHSHICSAFELYETNLYGIRTPFLWMILYILYSVFLTDWIPVDTLDWYNFLFTGKDTNEHQMNQLVILYESNLNLSTRPIHTTLCSALHVWAVSSVWNTSGGAPGVWANSRATRARSERKKLKWWRGRDTSNRFIWHMTFEVKKCIHQSYLLGNPFGFPLLEEWMCGIFRAFSSRK